MVLYVFVCVVYFGQFGFDVGWLGDEYEVVCGDCVLVDCGVDVCGQVCLCVDVVYVV